MNSGVFGRPTEVRGISVLYQVIYEGKIHYSVYLSEKMVLWNDFIIQVRAVKSYMPIDMGTTKNENKSTLDSKKSSSLISAMSPT